MRVFSRCVLPSLQSGEGDRTRGHCLTWPPNKTRGLMPSSAHSSWPVRTPQRAGCWNRHPDVLSGAARWREAGGAWRGARPRGGPSARSVREQTARVFRAWPGLSPGAASGRLGAGEATGREPGGWTLMSLRGRVERGFPAKACVPALLSGLLPPTPCSPLPPGLGTPGPQPSCPPPRLAHSLTFVPWGNHIPLSSEACSAGVSVPCQPRARKKFSTSIYLKEITSFLFPFEQANS